MSVHHAAIFSCEKFREETRWIMEQANQGNYEPLRHLACEAIRRFEQEWPRNNLGWTKVVNGVDQEVLTQEWPLFEHGGGSLPSVDMVRNISHPSSRELGYWFLIALAKYLLPCASPSSNWNVIRTALASVGWEQHDCNLLFQGLPVHKLIKPDALDEPDSHITDSSPYWLWMKLGRARSGWLPAEEVRRLYTRLLGMKGAIDQFDVRRIPNINVDNPIVVRDYNEYLRSGYYDTLGMLESANTVGEGLFMSIAL